MRFKGLVPLLLIFFAAHAEARVFSYKDALMAPYIRVTGAMVGASDNAFDGSSGDDTDLGKGAADYGYSGEVGLSFGLSQNLNFRVGAEIMRPHPVRTSGANPVSEANRFDLESTIFVFSPMATVEYVYRMMGNTRFFGSLSVGMADVTVENRYDMTATGTTDLGVADFTEKLSGVSTPILAGIGLETLFSANATFTFEFGYRYMPVNSLKYKSDVQNIVDTGGGNKGETVLNHDGSKRKVDLSGIFLSAGFRFYVF